MISHNSTLIYNANKVQTIIKDVYMADIICRVCEKPFPARRKDRPARYCNRVCYNIRNPKVKKTCSVCNKEFSHFKSERPNAEFCSKKCSGPTVMRRHSLKLMNRTMEEKIESLKSKFEEKVIKTDGCWQWTGLKMHKREYGMMVGLDGILMRSHRLSYLIYKGEIKKGLYVLHSCDNPPCTNPEHLFLGTQKENIQDMISKGRAKFGKKG